MNSPPIRHRLPQLPEQPLDVALFHDAMRINIDAIRREQEALANQHDQLESRITARQDVLERKIDENTTATNRIDKNTSEMAGLFASAKAGFEFLEKCSKVLGPLLRVGGALVLGGGVVWAAIKAWFHLGGSPGSGQ